MAGQKVGRLRILKRVPNSRGHTRWLCKCECGKETIVDSFNIRSGHTTSCGHCERYERIDDQTMKCVLQNGDAFLIDAEDYERVSQHKWSVENSGYIHSTYAGKHMRLHRFLLGNLPKVIDHINGDKTDNRKCNLRVCENKENIRNQKLMNRNKTGFKGVCLDKRRGKYESSITVDSKKKFLGYYENGNSGLESLILSSQQECCSIHYI